MLLYTNYGYYQVANFNCKSLLVVLELFGEPLEILKTFQEANPSLFPTESEQDKQNIENYQIVPIEEKYSIKKKGNFPWERIAEDLEKAKKRKIDKENKIKEEEFKLQKAVDDMKKKLKKQLQVRKLEQGVGRGVETLVYKEGVVQKFLNNQEDIILKEFSSAESDLEEAVKLMISKYSRVFKFLFSKYSGTGFEKKNHLKSDFDLHAERKGKLYDAELIRMMKDFDVVPKIVTKEEIRAIMQAYNHKIAKQAEQSFVGYKGFKGVFCQLAFFAFSRKPLDYSHLPPVVSLKYFLDCMRKSLKSKDQNTEIFDHPDPGTGDKDVVKSLNKLLAKDPKTPLPQGYEKITDKEIKVFYSVPNNLGFPPSYKYATEILADILAKLGVFILEPQIEYITTYRAKGVASVKQKVDLPPIHERNASVSKPVIKESVSPVPTKIGKLSPFLKLKIAQVPAKNKEIYEECAFVLEDILHSVKLNMKRVINRKPKIGAQQEKFEALKEREKQEEEAKKFEEEEKRKKRQEKLIRDLNRAKEERQNYLRNEEEKRKTEAEALERRKKDAEDKILKEKEEQRKKIEE